MESFRGKTLELDCLGTNSGSLTVGKLLNLSGFSFSICIMEMIVIIATSGTAIRIKCIRYDINA